MEPTDTTSGALPGGNYTAINHVDGTWTIKDVPIMAEIKKGDKRTPTDIGKDWMQAAVDISAARLKENYMAPLHIKHHDVGANTTRAGFVVPKKVDKITYDGKQVYAIFADLVKIPAEVFNRIEKGELPYRSVEIASWDKPEINSLAILDDDAPFFRFELLTVGQKVKSNTQIGSYYRRFESSESPALGLCGAKDTSLVLFKFKDGKMPMDQKPNGEADKKEEKAEKATSMQPEAKPEMKKEGEGDSSGAMLKAIYDMMMKMFAASQTPDRKDELKPAEQPKPKEEKPAEPNKYSDDSNIKLAELAGEVAALKAKETKREGEERISLMVTAACNELKGWPMSDDTANQIKIIAEKGEDAVKAFVTSYKANVPKDAPKTFSAFENGSKDSDPEEVMKYAKSPSDLESARKASALYDAVKSARLTNVSRARFLEIEMGRSKEGKE